MKITLITYRGESIHVVLDTNEKLVVPQTIEYINQLSNGKILDPEAYKTLKKESEIYLCKQKAFAILARSSKSAFEVRKYLQKKDFSDEIIKLVVDFLKEKNYLNDQEFAEKFINYKKRTKTVGSRYLADQLYKKGLSKDIINKAIKDTNAEQDDLDEVYLIAEKKMQSLQKKKNRLPKLVYFLQSRGFANQTIFKIIEKLKSSGHKFDDPTTTIEE